MQNEPAKKLLYTAREAAQMLSISVRTLWTLTKAGLIRAVYIGRSVRYADSDLRLYVDCLQHPEL